MKIIVNMIFYKKSPDGNPVVLLQKKWNHPLHGNKWCMFGGHRKNRESLEDTAKREAKEELGIDVRKPKRFKVFEFNSFGGLRYYVYYSSLTCELSDVSLKEGGGFALLSAKEIKNLPMIGNDRKILKIFFTFLARS
jgi:8-oxo-dGTP pyrophosphatase MutT (NUDIX family)